MLWRTVSAIGTMLALTMLVYLAAGLVGGSVPSHAGWRPPADGVAIYVEDNGIHTDLVLPKLAAGVDLSRLAPAHDLRDPQYGGYRWLAVGWGEAAFFLDTPTWADVRMATVLHAAVGSDRTLLHVEHVPEPRGDAARGVRRIVLRPAEYRRLAAFVIASRRPGGRVFLGYDRYDAFYEAQGRYNALSTCNAWTGRALRTAGVRVGIWTPLPVTVLGWF